MTITEFAQTADTVELDDVVEWDSDPTVNGMVIALDPAAALTDSEGTSVTGTAEDPAVLVALNDESGAPSGVSKVYLLSEVTLVADDDTDAVLAGEPPADLEMDEGMMEDESMMMSDARTFDFECVLVIEGAESGDRRFVELGALTWRDLPLPLMLQTQTPEASGHAGAIICGSIHDITRVGNSILGRGYFDSGDNGKEARRLVFEGTMRGVSADIDMVEAAVEVEEGQLAGGMAPKMILNAGRIMGATMTPFPAFQEAQMKLVDSALVASGRSAEFPYNTDERAELQVWSQTIPFNVTLDPELQPLVASGKVLSLSGEFPGGPAKPPAEWFDSPKLEELTPMQVTPDGQVFGHIAKWGQCHIGFGRCVTPPRSNSNYRWFRNKQVLTAEGKTVWTGPIYGGLPDHAPLDLTADMAQRWMAATGAASADVAVYEDRFGIVVAGAVRPDVTAGQVRALRGSDVSPDWRPIEGRREMVGLVSVNTSGFIVPAPASALVASGLPGDVFQRFGPPAGETTVSWDFEKDEPRVLVAVGMVRHSEAPVDQLARRLHEIEEFLLPIRAQLATSRITGSRLPFDQQFGREIHDVRSGKLLGSKKGDGNSDDSTPHAAIAKLEDANFHDEAAVLRETTDPDVIAGGNRLADNFDMWTPPADYPNADGTKSPVDSLREYGKGAGDALPVSEAPKPAAASRAPGDAPPRSEAPKPGGHQTRESAVATLEDVNFHDEAAVLRDTKEPQVITGGIRLADGFEGGYSPPADYPNFNGDKDPEDSLREYGKGESGFSTRRAVALGGKPVQFGREIHDVRTGKLLGSKKGDGSGIHDWKQDARGYDDQNPDPNQGESEGEKTRRAFPDPVAKPKSTPHEAIAKLEDANFHDEAEVLRETSNEQVIAGGKKLADNFDGWTPPADYPDQDAPGDKGPWQRLHDYGAGLVPAKASAPKPAKASAAKQSDPGPPVQDNFSNRRAVALGGSLPFG